MYLTGSDRQVLLVLRPGGRQASFEPVLKRPGQRDDAVLAALAVMDGDGALVEVDVLDAQPHAFDHPEAAAIHELGGELPRIFEMGEDSGDFPAREHHLRTAVGVTVARRLDGEILDAEDFSGEEDHGIERLFLGCCRDVALQRQIVEVSGHAAGTCVLRSLFQTFQTEAGEANHPMDVGLLGGVGKASETDSAAQGIDNAGDFSGGLGQGAGRLRRWGREFGTDLDGLTAKRAVAGFQRPGLIGKPAPIIGGCPLYGKDIPCQDTHGRHGLPELPVVKVGGAAEGIEERAGGVGGAIATGLGPGFCPADVKHVGGRLDRQRV